MKLILLCLGLLVTLESSVWARNLICYYDASSYLRQGEAKFTFIDLDLAAQLCTHIMYSPAGITHDTNEIKSLNVDLDMFHYSEVTALKRRHPHLKVFLSVGGDKDVDEAHPNKYIDLLEKGRVHQQTFIDSTIALLKRNNFDGIDLAFQLPRNKPRKVHSSIGMYWKKFKKLFTGDFIVDPEAENHKNNLTSLFINMKTSYRYANLSMSLTVLPNVNSSWYFDVPRIINSFDFITLAAFDFLTPQRNPDEADYTAPIYPLVEQDRLPHYNIDFQVSYWLNKHCPPQKLNLGIASYGRAWKLSTDSGQSGYPVVPETQGPAPAGETSQTPGLLSWPEICVRFNADKKDLYRGPDAPLRKVTDLEQKYGNYAYRPADDNGENGVWVSFDDPDFASLKMNYIKMKNLGGSALFDLSHDDVRGICTGQKFPILRSLKYYMQ